MIGECARLPFCAPNQHWDRVPWLWIAAKVATRADQFRGDLIKYYLAFLEAVASVRELTTPEQFAARHHRPL